MSKLSAFLAKQKAKKTTFKTSNVSLGENDVPSVANTTAEDGPAADNVKPEFAEWGDPLDEEGDFAVPVQAEAVPAGGHLKLAAAAVLAEGTATSKPQRERDVRGWQLPGSGKEQPTGASIDVTAADSGAAPVQAIVADSQLSPQAGAAAVAPKSKYVPPGRRGGATGTSSSASSRKTPLDVKDVNQFPDLMDEVQVQKKKPAARPQQSAAAAKKKTKADAPAAVGEELSDHHDEEEEGPAAAGEQAEGTTTTAAATSGGGATSAIEQLVASLSGLPPREVVVADLDASANKFRSRKKLPAVQLPESETTKSATAAA